jgi:hypothetical protein
MAIVKTRYWRSSLPIDGMLKSFITGPIVLKNSCGPGADEQNVTHFAEKCKNCGICLIIKRFLIV